MIAKICGLSTPETLQAALDAGADQIGLVFFSKSPRHLTLEQARRLAEQARGRAEIVVLTVDAGDPDLDGIVEAIAPDWLQLHGRETPERVADIRHRTGRKVMRAIGIGSADDLLATRPYRGIADRLLFDAKPPKSADRPGGNGVSFDWSILRGTPSGYMLSGGLTPDNVADAIRISGATAVDVSSGVETAPGQKDPGLIEMFLRAAKSKPT